MIFPHPTDPDRLIKVANSIKKTRYFKRYAILRYRRLRGWHRELSEYLVMLARNGSHCDRLPRYFGFCDTTLGPGLVVEKITNSDGALAPTLPVFIEQSQTPEVLKLLKDDLLELFDTLERQRIDFQDNHAFNIVVTGSDKPRLIIVDGIGGSLFIPITHFSDWAFRRKTDQGRRTLLDLIDKALHRAENEMNTT